MLSAAHLGGLTVNDIVRTLPHGADWLRVCDIAVRPDDSRSLDVACDAAAVDRREVAEGLAALASDHIPDVHVPLDRLCRFIVLHHHEYVRRSLPRVQAMFASLPADAVIVDRISVPDLFAMVSKELLAHLAKEENILFPAIAALAEANRVGRRATPGAFVTLLHPIRAMEGEHARVEDMLGHIRQLIRETDHAEGTPAVQEGYAALDAFDRDMRQHLRLENQLLFPGALDLERALA